MFSHTKQLFLVAMTLGFLFPGLAADAAKWRTAYYANQHSNPASLVYQPLSAVPWEKYTHVIQSAIVPARDINGAPAINGCAYNIYCVTNGNDTGNAQEFVASAHAKGVKALVSLIVGGGQQAIDMESNTNTDNIQSFVDILTNFVNDRGYDGIDVDWESSVSIDNYKAQFPEFIRGLRAAMPSKIITIAGGLHFRNVYTTAYNDGSGMRVYDKVDQINFMLHAERHGTQSQPPIAKLIGLARRKNKRATEGGLYG